MATRTPDDLMERYPANVQTLARAARTFLLAALPGAQETIDGSAPVIGYGYGLGYKGLVCTLLLSKSGVKIGLAHGAALPDLDHLLNGAGKVHRYVQIRSVGDLRTVGLRRLLMAANRAAHARLG